MKSKQQKKQAKKPVEEKKEVSFSGSKKIVFYSAASYITLFAAVDCLKLLSVFLATAIGAAP